MSKLKIGIVENEIIIASTISNTLQKIGYDVTEAASTYQEALEMIRNESPDIVLLDIHLKGSKDGIEIAHAINANFNIPFIYLTANTDAVTLERAKETNPHAFLVKPFTKDDLYTAIEICFSNFSKQKIVSAPTITEPPLQEYFINDALFIKEGSYYHKVKFSDIIYLEAEHVYVYVVTKTKRILVRSSLQQYLAHFDPNKFVQIHRKHVINVQYIETINSEVIVVNGITLAIGRTYRDNLLMRLKLG